MGFDRSERTAIARESLRQWMTDARTFPPHPEEFIFWTTLAGGVVRLSPQDAAVLRMLRIDPW